MPSWLITLFQSLPAIVDGLKQLLSILPHHTSPVAGTSIVTEPGSTNLTIQPKPPQGGGPAPTKWTPSFIKLIDSTINVDGNHVHVDAPYPANTHFHLDHNLAEPNSHEHPWPDKLEGVTYKYAWDGHDGSSADPADPGSIDPDGYAGRFNVHDLPDKLSHKLEVAFVLDGVTSAWLLLPIKDHPVPGTKAIPGGYTADDGLYHAGHYKCEDSGVANGKPATGVKVAIFYNGSHKELATPDLPYRNDDAAAAWIKAKNPALDQELKSPFKF